MKRLLEWKQRMLQSPLTRKPTPATLSLARSLPPGPSQRQTLPKVSARLHNQIQPSYNSYSSDDEGMGFILTDNVAKHFDYCEIFFVIFNIYLWSESRAKMHTERSVNKLKLNL